MLYGDILPTDVQGRIISAKWSDIMDAIKSFGGTELKHDYYTLDTYTTKASYSTSTYTVFENCITGSGGSLYNTSNTPYVRGVTNLISDSTNDYDYVD